MPLSSSPEPAPPGTDKVAASLSLAVAVARHRGQPRARAARDAVARPGLHGLREGVLSALLGQVPIAGHPDQGGHDAPPLLPERFGDRRADLRAHSTQNGLTSSFPKLATGCLDATSMASSRSAQSMMSYPAICSLVSANGPSAISTSPPRTATVVASLTGRSSLPSSRIPRRSISSTQAPVNGPICALSSGLSSTDSSAQTSIMYFTVPPCRVQDPAGAV